LRVIASNSKTWILDEPFAGLDEESIKALKKIFEQHLSKQGCIILANHQEVILGSNKIILEKNA
jgi:heme exporter protein A